MRVFLEAAHFRAYLEHMNAKQRKGKKNVEIG
jgi:hypothetical protein